MLEARGISKSYRGLTAVDTVDLTIGDGEIILLRGPNGAGKSTLGRILAGVEPPDEGLVYVEGRRLAPGNPAAARSSGIWLVPQEASLVDSLTALDNLFLLLEKSNTRPRRRREFRRWVSERLDEISGRLGLEVDPSIRVARGPQGWAHRVTLMAALIAEPRLLILDESLSALSAESISKLFDLLGERASRGSSTMIVSHAIGDSEPRCTRLLHMDGGRLCDGALEAPEGAPVSTAGLGTKAGVPRDSPDGRSDPRPVCPDDDVLLEFSAPLAAAWLEISGSQAPGAFSVRRGEIVGVTGDETGEFFGSVASMARGSSHIPQIAMRAAAVAVPMDYDGLALFPDLSVRDNLSLRSGRTIAAGDATFTRWQQALGLGFPATEKVGALSGGNRQKVAILGALLSDTDLVVLQEPFYSLDTDSAAALEKVLQEFAGRGHGVVVVCDDPSRLERFCNRTIRVRLKEPVSSGR